MFRYKITVSGDVQGIGYRFFTVREAQRLELTGWVRNRSNGDVEVAAEGERDKLDDFVKILKTKHSYATISDIQISKTKIEKIEFSGFDIVM